MPKADVKLFLDRLASAMAAAAVPPLLCPATPSAEAPMEMFAHDADEAVIPREDDGGRSTYSVVRVWGGQTASDLPQRPSIQCATNGPTMASALEQSQRCYNALLFPDDSPYAGRIRRGWAITGFTVSIFNLMPPTPIRHDAHGAEVVFNFEAGAQPA